MINLTIGLQIPPGGRHGIMRDADLHRDRPVAPLRCPPKLPGDDLSPLRLAELPPEPVEHEADFRLLLGVETPDDDAGDEEAMTLAELFAESPVEDLPVAALDDRADDAASDDVRLKGLMEFPVDWC